MEVESWPQYKCDKTVGAFEIGRIGEFVEHPSAGQGYTVIHSADEKHRFRASKYWIDRHAPEVGGYVIRYSNDYASYSPPLAFASGYTLIKE